jgi:putative oxidoreductase
MINERKYDIALLLLRLTVGLGMVIGHGWPKLMKLISGGEIQFMDFMGLGPTVSLVLAVFAEVLCALLITIGLFTRWASIPLIFTMFIAVAVANWGEPFQSWEKAFLYLIAYLCLFITGPGWYSADARIHKSF